MTISLLLIVGHVGGFELSSDVRLLSLKLGEAARPQYLYVLVWLAEFWLTFAYWQYFRQSPDYSNEKSFLKEFMRHDVLQRVATDLGPDMMRRVRNLDQDAATGRFSYQLHESEDQSSPHEVKVIGDEELRAYRRRARRHMYLHKPEALALRMPIWLLFVAIGAAIIDLGVLGGIGRSLSGG